MNDDLKKIGYKFGYLDAILDGFQVIKDWPIDNKRDGALDLLTALMEKRTFNLLTNLLK